MALVISPKSCYMDTSGLLLTKKSSRWLEIQFLKVGEQIFDRIESKQKG